MSLLSSAANFITGNANPIGVGLDLVGGLSSLFGGNAEANRQKQLYNQAQTVLQNAQNYNPETNAQFRTAHDVGDMNLGAYWNQMQNKALGEYGHQGLLGSSMALSSLGPQAVNAYHGMSGQNKLGVAQLGNQLTNENWQRANQYSNALMGMGGEYGNLANQYYQGAQQGFTGAGNLLGMQVASGNLAKLLAKNTGQTVDDSTEDPYYQEIVRRMHLHQLPALGTTDGS